MRNLFSKLIFTAVLCCLSMALFAQDESGNRYYVVDYMQVKPGMHQEYLKLEKAWKKIHQYNIKAGNYSYWAVSELISPLGSNTEYNYVTRTNFNGEKQIANHLEHFDMPKDLSVMLSPEEIDLVNRTGQIREFVKSEVWMRQDQVMSENMDESTIAVFNYFDFPETGSRSAHLKVERDYWMPVHQARIKDGQMKGWVLLTKRMPGGSAEPYFDATVDIYEDMEQYLSMGNPTPYLEQFSKNKSASEIFRETEAAANLIRTEVRRRILDSE